MKATKLRALLAIVLAVLMLFTTVAASAAEDVTGDAPYTITKISNPDRSYRDGDGLVEGGDRETSYTWCMADRGDYIYIGTNKNIGGLVADALIAAFEANGVDEETVWALGNVLCNGEIPRPHTETGGYILRVSKQTGEIVNLYTAPKNVSFRMAITFGDSIFFGSYAADAVSSNDILRIDKNDNIETVFSSTNGTSMRAACILDDKLYFGGVDESETLAQGDEACKKLAILEKDNNDDSVWNRVADYKDFGKKYTTDPGVQGNITSPIWDICSYNGEIYATVPNAGGFAMFKGHPAAAGEEANEYGWNWQEVVGYFNGVNNIGLCDDPEGYTGVDYGMLSVTATPFVFNDELYVMDFDMTIYSEIYAVQGIITQLAKKTGKPSEYLSGLYSTMNHPQSVWKLNNETGKFVKSEGFAKVADNPCTEYLWRTAVYDGELYLGTMDSATIYNYVTKLTNASFLSMTPEEFKDQIDYIKTLVKAFTAKADEQEIPADLDGKVGALAATAAGMLNDFEAIDLDPVSAADFIERYGDMDEIVRTITEAITEKLAQSASVQEIMELVVEAKQLKDKVTELVESIDWEGLRMYAYISNAVKDDVWGFEIFKTADGENWDVVTNDGFGDKYNYGARTLLATDAGLYIGTANPFYGTQLWRLTNNTAAPEVMIGDVDGDGKVDIYDASAIQKSLAGGKDSVDYGALSKDDPRFIAADIDGNGAVDIYDASLIQKWIAGDTSAAGYKIGE